jgi:hypothetical protein
MASRKIPIAMKLRDCFVGKAFFFGSFLLTLIKRNELGRVADETLLLFTANGKGAKAKSKVAGFPPSRE